jgi:G3E family GTPase
VYGRVPTPAIVSHGSEPAIGVSVGQGCEADGNGHEHILADGFTAHAVSIDGPLSARRLQAWLNEGLPETVFRAKGIFRLDSLDGWCVFQFCGGRASFEPYPGTPRESGIVFIGRGIDPKALGQRVEYCRLR